MKERYQTDRQTHRQTNKQKDREINREEYKWIKLGGLKER
jgi:hypothetical protein